jgi:hypothetical protein
VNDGSNMSGIQVVLEPGVAGWELLEGGQLATGERSNPRAKRAQNKRKTSAKQHLIVLLDCFHDVVCICA